MMCLFASGFAEVLFVQLDDGRILMRLADGQRLVLGIQSLCTDCADIGEVLDRSRDKGLSAAVDTAAGASHNFDELIICLTVADSGQQLLSICQTGADRNIEGYAADGIGCFLDAFGAADSGEVHLFSRSIGTGQPVVCSSQSSFHNAAGCAEDYAGTSAESERLVEFLVRKEVEVQTRSLNHLSQFSGGQCDIDIGYTGSRLIVSADLKLLRGTGHDRNDDKVLGVDAHLFRIPGLGNRAEHLLG